MREWSRQMTTLKCFGGTLSQWTQSRKRTCRKSWGTREKARKKREIGKKKRRGKKEATRSNKRKRRWRVREEGKGRGGIDIDRKEEEKMEGR